MARHKSWCTWDPESINPLSDFCNCGAVKETKIVIDSSNLLTPEEAKFLVSRLETITSPYDNEGYKLWKGIISKLRRLADGYGVTK